MPRDPLRFDLPKLLDVFGREQSLSLLDPQAQSTFLTAARNARQRALSDEDLLRGLRTGSMFGGVVVGLGRARLLKPEDAGDILVGGDDLQPPDYRLALIDGTHMLVEVKNYFQGRTRAFKEFSLTQHYLDRLTTYAELVGWPLRIAKYWASWNMWTLMSPEAFTLRGTRWIITIEEAAKANEMATLGDMTVGTRFPLEMRMVADKTKPRSLSRGQARFTVGSVEFYSQDHRITVAQEQQSAFYFMLYGNWPVDGPNVLLSEGEVAGAEFVAVPKQDPHQGFEIIGTLSGMYSQSFLQATTDDGKVERLGL